MVQQFDTGVTADKPCPTSNEDFHTCAIPYSRSVCDYQPHACCRYAGKNSAAQNAGAKATQASTSGIRTARRVAVTSDTPAVAADSRACRVGSNRVTSPYVRPASTLRKT